MRERREGVRGMVGRLREIGRGWGSEQRTRESGDQLEGGRVWRESGGEKGVGQRREEGRRKGESRGV